METELRTARYNFQYFRCRLYHPRIYDGVTVRVTEAQTMLQVRINLGHARVLLLSRTVLTSINQITN